ncbi:hypothetical protein AA106556_1431 [Neokomagataea tanensis NBRC 106556]|uniref:Uncharacterized protein n=1 Tax=Neokomagataea tanensis NBRC 106556 TaxID=1223519 RepID=A0ABQ0QJV8_9PROT|nr:hypothetical protein AA106556_1431 [Neokomagataea tanensis NBRC 106556]
MCVEFFSYFDEHLNLNGRDKDLCFKFSYGKTLSSFINDRIGDDGRAG